MKQRRDASVRIIIDELACYMQVIENSVISMQITIHLTLVHRTLLSSSYSKS